MATTIWGRVSYPGIEQAMSASYTCSHGLSPGTVSIRALPQATIPIPLGTVLLYDGVNSVKIPDCRLDRIDVQRNNQGEEWTYLFQDRRWRWHDYGCISGCYNQLDPSAKLIPWTVRSPRELAILCLRAMGETRYKIDLPNGLSRADATAAGAARFLRPGENFTPSGLNPPINWQGECPGQALARLAEQFGRRIVYNLKEDALWICRPGVGSFLPTGGSIAQNSPRLGIPAVPEGIAVYGVPTRFQDRLQLEPVGEEWDGSIRPINSLSYAPLSTGAKTKWLIRLRWTSPLAAANILRVLLTLRISINGKGINNNIGADQPILFTYTCLTGGETDATAAASLATTLNQGMAQFLVASTAAGGGPGGTILYIEAASHEVSLSVSIGTDDNNSGNGAATLDDRTLAVAGIIVAGQPPRPDWSYCAPPEFWSVRATDRLTVVQARELAKKSIWKMYRITGRTGAKPYPNGPMMTVPAYGPIRRIQQIVLQDKMVEQVVPQEGDQNIIRRQGLQEPVIINFYNGLSRDKPAAVYGRHSFYKDNVFFLGLASLGEDVETDDSSQVHVDFSVDAEQSMIVFSREVVRMTTADGPGLRKYIQPDLLLEAAFNLRGEDTNQVECFVQHRRLSQPKGVLVPTRAAGQKQLSLKFIQTQDNWFVQHKEDVQLNVYQPYNTNGTRQGGPRILEADPVARANYYLNGMQAQFILNLGNTVRYNGVMPISCDGAIAQVSWEIGEGGTSTTASRNNEHDIWVPPYPARRRAELMRPAAAERLEMNVRQRINLAGPGAGGFGGGAF